MTAKDTTERQRNIERWSVLEPERCREVGRAFKAMRAENFVLVNVADEKFYEDEDALLGALIEAVIARGWLFQLGNDDGFTSYVAWGDKGTDQSTGKADNAADSLLIAYVSGLETTK